MTTAQDNAPACSEQDRGSADHPTEPVAAGIAETVGRVLAMAAAAASPSRPAIPPRSRRSPTRWSVCWSALHCAPTGS